MCNFSDNVIELSLYCIAMLVMFVEIDKQTYYLWTAASRFWIRRQQPSSESILYRIYLACLQRYNHFPEQDSVQPHREYLT